MTLKISVLEIRGHKSRAKPGNNDSVISSALHRISVTIKFQTPSSCGHQVEDLWPWDSTFSIIKHPISFSDFLLVVLKTQVEQGGGGTFNNDMYKVLVFYKKCSKTCRKISRTHHLFSIPLNFYKDIKIYVCLLMQYCDT